MKRLNLFEFEDQSWFPQIFRNYVTDFLRFTSDKYDIYQTIVPLLLKGIEKTEKPQIIDIAAGGGGGWLSLSKHLFARKPDLKIILSDYFPNIPAFKKLAGEGGKNFEYIETPIDARKVPSELIGLRTQFLSFHHFQPEDAVKILQNAVDSKSPICIIEAQERSVICLIAMLISPLNVLISTPFIKPFSVGRVIFTYLIPVVPLVVLWDGIVSMLRTYSIAEMHELVAKVQNGDSFEWEIGRKENRGLPTLFLLGYPNLS